MKKEDIKAFFSIILILALIGALTILGINLYARIQGKDSPLFDAIESAYTNVIGNITNENSMEANIGNDLLTNLDNVPQSGKTNIKCRYFYNQLNLYSKIIYNALDSNKENMKNGTYKIEFNKEFDKLLEQENGAELLKSYYQSAIETYLYDNPDIFYIEPTKMYINIQTVKKFLKTEHKVFIDSGKDENYFEQDYISKEQVIQNENQIEEIVKQILKPIEKATDYQKILTIHDYLVNNTSFDETLSKENIFNIYGAIVNKVTVCEGYAKAFKYLLNRAGIECILVVGEATNSDGNTESHAWNYVKLNNVWYAVDVTWDDPILRGSGYIGNDIKYKYFLKGSLTMGEDHMPKNKFTEDGQEYEYPILSTNNY